MTANAQKLSNAAETISYMPQLDGIRALAIIFVIISHWFAPFFSTGFIPYGDLGVYIFFVLSGFLITSILLRYKASISVTQTKWHFIKTFYIRRSLRIFPIYYLSIIVVLFVYPALFEGAVWWHCTYLSNFYFVLVKQGFQQPISHWWTLSVEEQFYVLWPFLILFSSLKAINWYIYIAIVIAVLFRRFVPISNYLYLYLTPSCIDALACGALLALRPEALSKITASTWFKLYAIGLFILIMVLTKYPPTIYRGLNRLVYCAFALLIIAKASDGFKGVVGFILNNRFVKLIGKISYGLYLYHKFISAIDIPVTPVALLQTVRIALLVCVATLSYFIIERPLLHLKKYA